MKISLNVGSPFLIVTAGALIGIVLGGGFGYAAAMIAPDLFTHVIPWMDFDPLGTATVVGAFGGVMCGGGRAHRNTQQTSDGASRLDRERSGMCWNFWRFL